MSVAKPHVDNGEFTLVGYSKSLMYDIYVSLFGNACLGAIGNPIFIQIQYRVIQSVQSSKLL